MGALAPLATRFIFGPVQRTAHRGNCRLVCRLHAARRRILWIFREKKRNNLITTGLPWAKRRDEWNSNECTMRNHSMEMPVEMRNNGGWCSAYSKTECKFIEPHKSPAARAMGTGHTLHQSCIRTFRQFKIISRISVHASPCNCTTNAIKTMRFW